MNLLTEAEKMERVERVVEKTGLTYEEAKDALEANNWDMLETMVYLERLGMVREPKQASQTTEEEKAKEFKQASEEYEKQAKGGFGDTVSKFLKWCGKIIKIGCENTFRISRDGEKLLDMPLIILVLLLISSFWTFAVLLIVGLFFRFRYSFDGALFEGNAAKVNDACEKAADACENVKKEFSEK